MGKASKNAVRERMKQAKETLEEAETLFEQDYWRGTINRAYYAMFYAVLALAASKDVVISKHTHAIAFLDKEFIKKGIFQKNSHAPCTSISMNDRPTITGKSGK
ncbi:MAG: HEPN domain-containing protein [Anaerolineales bacterium]|nr:HEPN domain-containing protein [Anaerolineales bacterium]